ncbi:hypothetical protein U1Q18_007819, partial [Sarracenia purpurea var. burkii]
MGGFTEQGRRWSAREAEVGGASATKMQVDNGTRAVVRRGGRMGPGDTGSMEMWVESPWMVVEQRRAA